MKDRELLGSYEAQDGRILTYYSEDDYDFDWVITQQTKGEKKFVDVDPRDIIRELLIHINDLEERAWEEAMGEDL